MIALFLLAYVLLAFFAIVAIFEKNLKLHIIIVSIMYAYYCYLWYDRLFLSHNVKPAWIGFSLLLNTIFTAPFYVIFHILAIYKSWNTKNKTIVCINIIGLLLCIIHIINLIT
ncbi:hypothetical protein AMR72_09175 [Flavobacterium psychrophilum]|nr:hypothetical protein AMR72_09175 [Flavobacterium psychrophilum]AOE52662.1 hypothetical protein ALW18_09165 [Flavobacterium psychrophilum]